MRLATIIAWSLVACGKSERAPVASDAAIAASDAAPRTIDAPALPEHRTFDDLASAFAAIVPADARVLGIGELHSRVDRKSARSSLAAFSELVPALGARMSDLVVETYVIDKKCGQAAVVATKKVETAVRRPEATKSEIGQLVEAARRAKVQPHAMTLSCKDYEAIAPAKGDADPVAMLDITTKELTRVTTQALAVRAKQKDARPWIVVYGGALHNDRFPAESVAEWSYAAAIDKATGDKYVEIDLLVPELAEADKASQAQPWFPLVAAARRVTVWQRGERSFVVLLPR